MDRIWIVLVAAVIWGGLWLLLGSRPQPGEPPLLALVDYTSDNPQGADGVAIIDLNPHSKRFGVIMQKYPIGPGVSPHHLYYNHDGSKLYTTALGGARLYRVDLEGTRIRAISPVDTGPCQVGEDLYFTEDGTKFYLTCLGSHMVAVFDAATEQMIGRIEAPAPDEPFIKHPHGISVNEEIDRMLITETIAPDLTDPGASVTVIQPSTGQVLKTFPIGPSGSAPVEVFFLPGEPIAYITAMFGDSLWMVGGWDESTQEFSMVHLVDDLMARCQGVPLEMYVGPDGNFYLSVARPGVVNVYDISDPMLPQFLKTLPADAGAHHIAFTEKYMFVQNNLLNLEKLNAGTISVVDLRSGKRVANLASFVQQGLKPASLVLLGQPGHH
jgi:DNA-binding beta-propeller fold protein YncE